MEIQKMVLEILQTHPLSHLWERVAVGRERVTFRLKFTLPESSTPLPSPPTPLPLAGEGSKVRSPTVSLFAESAISTLLQCRLDTATLKGGAAVGGGGLPKGVTLLPYARPVRKPSWFCRIAATRGKATSRKEVRGND